MSALSASDPLSNFQTPSKASSGMIHPYTHELPLQANGNKVATSTMEQTSFIPHTKSTPPPIAEKTHKSFGDIGVPGVS